MQDAVLGWWSPPVRRVLAIEHLDGDLVGAPAGMKPVHLWSLQDLAVARLTVSAGRDFRPSDRRRKAEFHAVSAACSYRESSERRFDDTRQQGRASSAPRPTAATATPLQFAADLARIFQPAEPRLGLAPGLGDPPGQETPLDIPAEARRGRPGHAPSPRPRKAGASRCSSTASPGRASRGRQLGPRRSRPASAAFDLRQHPAGRPASARPTITRASRPGSRRQRRARRGRCRRRRR